MSGPNENVLALQFVDAKLSWLYDKSTSGIAKGINEVSSLLNRAIIELPCEVNRSSTSRFELTFGKPQLRASSRSPESACVMRLFILEFRSPEKFSDKKADCTISIPYESFDVNPGPRTRIRKLKLVLNLQEASVGEVQIRKNSSDDNGENPITNEDYQLLGDMVKAYLKTLHEAGLHALLSHAVLEEHTAVSSTINPPTIPPIKIGGIDVHLINNYLWALWKIPNHKKLETFDHEDYTLTFKGPPTISPGEDECKIYLDFRDVTARKGKSSSTNVSVLFGGRVLESPQDQLQRELRIDTNASLTCKNPDAEPGDTSRPIIIAALNSYMQVLWNCGFDTLYSSLRWNILVRSLEGVEDEAARHTGFTESHEPHIADWDCEIVVSQALVNAQVSSISDDAEAGPTFQLPQREEIPARRAKFKMTHVKLLSEQEAILWLHVTSLAVVGDGSYARADENIVQQRVKWENIRLAFKVTLKLQAPVEHGDNESALWDLCLDTATADFDLQSSVLSFVDDDVKMKFDGLLQCITNDYFPFMERQRLHVLVQIPIIGTATKLPFMLSFPVGNHEGDTGRGMSSQIYAIRIVWLLSKATRLADTPWATAFLRSSDCRCYFGPITIARPAFFSHILLPQLAHLNDLIAYSLVKSPSAPASGDPLHGIKIGEWSTSPVKYETTAVRSTSIQIRGNIIGQPETTECKIRATIIEVEHHAVDMGLDLKIVYEGGQPKDGLTLERTLHVFQVAQNDVVFYELSESVTHKSDGLEKEIDDILSARGRSPIVNLQADIESVKLDANGNFVITPRRGPLKDTDPSASLARGENARSPRGSGMNSAAKASVGNGGLLVPK
ncbi:hypothetical protein C8Q73DRAFT_786125 [Cubamyces lactineus]|nr:hypothetical protein C8Q73DRAFT_786125 [Cubamyces lactineus]